MNNERLGVLIAQIGSNIDGQTGFWQFDFGEVRLICITDETHDRMRVMTPIASVEELSSEHMLASMTANFDRALDARYCVNNDTLWGAFIHPLSCLSAAHFRSGCQQVAEVANNFGTSFSSGVLRFGG